VTCLPLSVEALWEWVAVVKRQLSQDLSLRSWVEARELRLRGHHILGFAAPPNPDRETEAAVLVELEVHCQHVGGAGPGHGSPSRRRAVPTFASRE
jgi:hypothetical protein